MDTYILHAFFLAKSYIYMYISSKVYVRVC